MDCSTVTEEAKCLNTPNQRYRRPLDSVGAHLQPFFVGCQRVGSKALGHPSYYRPPLYFVGHCVYLVEMSGPHSPGDCDSDSRQVRPPMGSECPWTRSESGTSALAPKTLDRMPATYSDRARRSIPATEYGEGAGSSELWKDGSGAWGRVMRQRRTLGRFVSAKSEVRSGHSLD